MDRRGFDRLETTGLIVEVSQIVLHEGDKPDVLADLSHAEALAREHVTEVTFHPPRTSASRLGYRGPYRHRTQTSRSLARAGPVAVLTHTHFRTLSPTTTLGAAVYLLRTSSQQDFPVVANGHIEGILTRSNLIKALPRAGRSGTVAEAMKRDCPTPDSSEMLETVLARLQGQDCHTIAVLENGTFVGLVTMDNVGEFLMILAAEKKG